MPKLAVPTLAGSRNLADPKWRVASCQISACVSCCRGGHIHLASPSFTDPLQVPTDCVVHTTQSTDYISVTTSDWWVLVCVLALGLLVCVYVFCFTNPKTNGDYFSPCYSFYWFSPRIWEVILSTRFVKWAARYRRQLEVAGVVISHLGWHWSKCSLSNSVRWTWLIHCSSRAEVRVHACVIVTPLSCYLFCCLM